VSSTRDDDARSSAASAESVILDVPSESVEQTRRLGAILGRLLASGAVVLLYGELGAGKTAFTQGIGRGLGVAATVNSPTFTILKEYAGRLPLYHFDLYRIEDPGELETLGFVDYFAGDGVSVIEWAERGETDGEEALWRPDALRVRFERGAGTGRLLHFSATGTDGRRLLDRLADAIAREVG
jgi:tRNA threonylcarbamoyladenosine biosynthesis protein TsaE